MDIILWVFGVIAVLIAILIIGAAIGCFIKRADKDIERMISEEKVRRFWERKR